MPARTRGSASVKEKGGRRADDRPGRLHAPSFSLLRAEGGRGETGTGSRRPFSPLYARGVAAVRSVSGTGGPRRPRRPGDADRLADAEADAEQGGQVVEPQRIRPVG